MNSVLNQSYRDVECVVIDDGSTDETRQILTALVANKLISYHYKRNQGVSSARNVGIEKSNGDYLLFLDADDTLTSNAISELMSCLLEKNADMCVGLAQSEGDIKQRFPYERDYLANMITNWWPVSSVLLKKSSLSWDESMKTWEVIDYFSRHILNNFTCAICPNIVTIIDHGERASRATFLYDHYNAYHTFMFFSKLKEKIISSEKASPNQFEAIDKQLLGNVYKMYINSKKLPALSNLDRKALKKYAWFKPFGLSGFCNLLGFNIGIPLFYNLNLLLRRV